MLETHLAELRQFWHPISPIAQKSAPSNELAAEMKTVGKISAVKIYPAFGKTAQQGHSFAYLGSEIWEKDVFLFLKQHCQL